MTSTIMKTHENIKPIGRPNAQTKKRKDSNITMRENHQTTIIHNKRGKNIKNIKKKKENNTIREMSSHNE